MINAELAAVALFMITAAEGVRRLPSNAIVLRRSPLGRWRLIEPRELGAGLSLVSLCIPLATPLVVSRGSSSDAERFGHRRLMARMQSRARRTRSHIATVRLLGIVIVAALCVGLPIAVQRFGTLGLFVSVEVIFALATLQTFITVAALRRAGLARAAAVVAAVRLLSPFTAPRAAEIVQIQNASEVPGMIVAYALLGEDGLVDAMRPFVYDLVHGMDGDDAFETLESLIGHARLTELLATPPAAADESTFCPRCGAVFRSGVSHCSDCTGVAVLTASHSVARSSSSL